VVTSLLWKKGRVDRNEAGYPRGRQTTGSRPGGLDVVCPRGDVGFVPRAPWDHDFCALERGPILSARGGTRWRAPPACGLPLGTSRPRAVEASFQRPSLEVDVLDGRWTHGHGSFSGRPRQGSRYRNSSFRTHSRRSNRLSRESAPRSFDEGTFSREGPWSGGGPPSVEPRIVITRSSADRGFRPFETPSLNGKNVYFLGRIQVSHGPKGPRSSLGIRNVWVQVPRKLLPRFRGPPSNHQFVCPVEVRCRPVPTTVGNPRPNLATSSAGPARCGPKRISAFQAPLTASLGRRSVRGQVRSAIFLVARPPRL